jgi:hypothetical protein
MVFIFSSFILVDSIAPLGVAESDLPGILAFEALQVVMSRPRKSLLISHNWVFAFVWWGSHLSLPSLSYDLLIMSITFTGRFTQAAVRALDWVAERTLPAEDIPIHQRTGRRGEEAAYFYLRR